MDEGMLARPEGFKRWPVTDSANIIDVLADAQHVSQDNREKGFVIPTHGAQFNPEKGTLIFDTGKIISKVTLGEPDNGFARAKVESFRVTKKPDGTFLQEQVRFDTQTRQWVTMDEAHLKNAQEVDSSKYSVQLKITPHPDGKPTYELRVRENPFVEKTEVPVGTENIVENWPSGWPEDGTENVADIMMRQGLDRLAETVGVDIEDGTWDPDEATYTTIDHGIYTEYKLGEEDYEKHAGESDFGSGSHTVEVSSYRWKEGKNGQMEKEYVRYDTKKKQLVVMTDEDRKKYRYTDKGKYTGHIIEVTGDDGEKSHNLHITREVILYGAHTPAVEEPAALDKLVERTTVGK